VTVYIVFLGGLTGNGGKYTVQDLQIQGCDFYRPDGCSLIVLKNTGKTLNLDKGCINFSGVIENELMGPCPTTMFEINNGFNYVMNRLL
jgi:hypothetical protein